jgi:Transglutaminase-like superfamily
MLRFVSLCSVCFLLTDVAIALGEEDAPLPPPIVERIDHHDWIVRTDIYFGAERLHWNRRSRVSRVAIYDEDTMQEALGRYISRRLTRFSSGSFKLYLPLIEEGATHTIDPESLAVYFDIADRDLEPQPFEIRRGEGLSENLVVAQVGGVDRAIVDIRMDRLIRTYDSTFHEDRAAACPFWSYWPAEIDEFLKPSDYIDSHDPEVVQLVKSWIGDEYWRVSPHLAAKALTGKVLETIRLNGTSIRKYHIDLPFYEGLEVKGARGAFADGEGTHVDIACAIVASLRIAEIPARVVLGIDSESEELRIWFEYCLHDAVRNENCWVPVDLDDVRAQTHGTPDITRRWDGFGHFGPIEDRIPLSYHFQPHVGFNSGLPCMWSWEPDEDCRVMPHWTLLNQIVDHDVMTAPNRGEEELGE